MADGRRPSSSEGAPRGRSQGGRPGTSSSGRSDKPRSDKPRSDKPRSDKPRSDGGRGRSDSARGGQGRSSSGRPPRKGDWSRPATEQGPRTVDQERYDGPPLPEEITGRELDRSVSGQLKGLPDKLALRVARHLAAAGVLIDSDPETAYQHTLAARARASRLAVVREALGEAGYAPRHKAPARAELPAPHPQNRAPPNQPLMADCQRALGHPEQALKLAKSPAVANFSSAAKAEMTLVEAGARRDMGQLDAALRTLELAPLQSKSREPWVVRLRYAYADTLESAGRETEALAWFHRTHAVDSQDLTDAADRAEVLEKRLD